MAVRKAIQDKAPAAKGRRSPLSHGPGSFAPLGLETHENSFRGFHPRLLSRVLVMSYVGDVFLPLPLRERVGVRGGRFVPNRAIHPRNPPHPCPPPRWGEGTEAARCDRTFIICGSVNSSAPSGREAQPRVDKTATTGRSRSSPDRRGYRRPGCRSRRWRRASCGRARPWRRSVPA